MTSEKPPIRIMTDDNGKLEIVIGGFDESPEQRTARKSNSARCGHVKRLLACGERLTGDLLTFVLDMGVDDDIARKLQAGEKLTDHELHLMLDVYLVHQKLSPR